MFLDVADAGGAVGLEQEGEYFSNPVGKHFAFLYIAGAFGTGIELVCQTARADLTPVCFLVLFTSGTFSAQELAASSAIKAASGNVLRIGYDCFMLFHINRILNACQFLVQAFVKKQSVELQYYYIFE